jgi:hypothetical protein
MECKSPADTADVGAIVGGVVGGVVGLLIIGALLWFFLRKKRSHRDDFDDMMVSWESYINSRIVVAPTY